MCVCCILLSLHTCRTTWRRTCRLRSVPHPRPCGDLDCELHKSEVSILSDINAVINNKQCSNQTLEILVPVFVLDGSEIAKTLGRGQWVETPRKDPRGRTELRGRHGGITYHHGECHLHHPVIPPHLLRNVTDPEVSRISVNPAHFPGLGPGWLIRDIRQVYPCVDHASTYAFGDLMAVIRHMHPESWDICASQNLLPMQSKMQKTTEDTKNKKKAEQPGKFHPPMLIPVHGISYHFKSVRNFMFSPMKATGKPRLDVFLGKLPAGARGPKYCMLVLRNLVALHLSPPEVLEETWELSKLEDQCEELRILGMKFAFNYFKLGTGPGAGRGLPWRWPSHWYTAHMHDYHRIIPTSVGRTEGDEWKHHWLERFMAGNRKMEISAGVGLLERALTDAEVGTNWRREHGLVDQPGGIKDLKRIEVELLMLCANKY